MARRSVRYPERTYVNTSGKLQLPSTIYTLSSFPFCSFCYLYLHTPNLSHNFGAFPKNLPRCPHSTQSDGCNR